jgi:transcriptional regulator with XRE-family HTH domain
VSQEEAAAAVGMDRAHLAHLEQGHHEPGVYRLARLLGYYGCDPGECCRRIDARARIYQRHQAKRS